METSALESTNIEEAFKKLISEVYTSAIKNSTKVKEDTNINQGIKINDKNSKTPSEGKKCCK
jgi:hypothetical protein